MRAERPIPLAPGRRPDVGGRLFGRHCRRGVCTTSPDMRTLPDPVSLDSGSTGRGHRHSLVRRHHLHPNRRGLALRCHRDRHCLPPRRRAGPPATKLYTSLLADALTVACHQRQPQERSSSTSTAAAKTQATSALAPPLPGTSGSRSKEPALLGQHPG